MTTGKTIALTRQTFVGKVRSLLLNTLSRLVIAFLQRSSFMAAVTVCSDLGIQESKVCHCFISPFICHEVMGPDAMIFIFECWVLSQIFHSPLSLSSRGSLVLFTFCNKGGVVWGYWYFSWQPLQHSCLENPMGRAWQATVHGVAKSQTQLSDFTFTFTFHHVQQSCHW